MNSSDFPPLEALLAAPLDPLDAVGHADPYPYYASLAARPGLYFEPRLQLWVAASAASVKAVMAHPDCRVRPLAEPVPAAIAGGMAGEIFGALVRMNEGERHAQPKLALQHALAAVPLELAQQRAADIGRRCWGGEARNAGLTAWIFQVPVMTMASLIGFPDAQLPALAEWMGRFVACLSPLSNGAQIADAHVAARELMESFKALMRDAAPSPGSLLALVLAQARAAGWDDAHGLLANLTGLLSQTYEATAGLLGNSVIALVRQPEEERCEPADAAALVQAVSFLDPPVQNTRRYVARACQVDGVALDEGQTILLLLAAASRDPRGDRHAFGFGYGPHACPGHALACAIATGAMEAALEHVCGSTPGGADYLQALRWNYRRSLNARIPEFTLA